MIKLPTSRQIETRPAHQLKAVVTTKQQSMSFYIPSIDAEICTLWIRVGTGIGRLVEHIWGIKLVRTLTFSLDVWTIADRTGYALQNLIEAASFAD